MKLKHSVIGGGLIVALSVGACAVPVAANAAAVSRPIAVSSTALSGIEASSIARAAHTAPAVGTGTANGLATEQQAGALVRAFIAAVKKWGAAAYQALVKAVKSGYSAFVRWLGTVPNWVKNVVSGLTTSALYDTIRQILGL